MSGLRRLQAVELKRPNLLRCASVDVLGANTFDDSDLDIGPSCFVDTANISWMLSWFW